MIKNEVKRTLDEADKKIVACNQKWACQTCKKLLPSTYEIDHIIPFSISFNDDYENLQALCPNCHRKKTQTENKRINKFKKLCSIRNSVLCWYCLKEYTKNHKCKKICKEIKFVTKKKFDNNVLNSFIFTKQREYKSLKIKLTPDVIWINNYFTDMEDKYDNYNIDRIVKAISIATKHSNDKYDSVDVTIDFMSFTDEKIPDELVDHLNKYLPNELFEMNILNDPKNTEYNYICIDD